MNDFAIVAEGMTDQAVLRRILLTFYKEQGMEPAIVAEQPRVDATGEKQWREYGTWLNVVRYLEEKLYRDAFQLNQHVVIQIDTDCSEEVGYGVAQQERGQTLGVPKLIRRVVARLEALIGPEDCAAYAGRFLFAVCVQELECWLLPLWTTEDKKAKTLGCLNALNTALARKNQPTINPEDKKVPVYILATADYKKRAVLMSEGAKNESLRVFLERLSARNITIQPT